LIKRPAKKSPHATTIATEPDKSFSVRQKNASVETSLHVLSAKPQENARSNHRAKRGHWGRSSRDQSRKPRADGDLKKSTRRDPNRIRFVDRGNNYMGRLQMLQAGQAWPHNRIVGI
jgi:hypothetical protein